VYNVYSVSWHANNPRRKGGDLLFEQGKIADAINYYWMVVKTIISVDSSANKSSGTINVPSLDGPEGTVFSKTYRLLSPFALVQLAGLYTGLIRCYLKENDIETVRILVPVCNLEILTL
jgi:hypothetical protein